MQLLATDANGVEFSSNAPHLDNAAIDALNTFELSRKGIKDRIDNLDISADAKFMLPSVLDKTVEVVVGTEKVLIWVGRKILEIAMFLARNYPNATFGMILGTVVGLLISSIPIIGLRFGGIVPLLAMLGLSLGAVEDLKPVLAGDPRVRKVFSQCDPLRTNDHESGQ